MTDRGPGVRLDLVDDDLVVASWIVDQFSEPAREYDADGKTDEVIAYDGPNSDDHGQTYFELLVYPRSEGGSINTPNGEQPGP